MHSYEQRKKAVDLYYQYNKQWTAVIRELDYVKSITSLRQWVKQYEETGDVLPKSVRKPKYTVEQRKIAVDYYLQHGKNIAQTCRVLGYPNRHYLKKWIEEDAPGELRPCKVSPPIVQYSNEQKEVIAKEICLYPGSIKDAATDLKVSRTTIYNWKKKHIGKGREHSMAKEIKHLSVDSDNLTDERDELKNEVLKLKQEVYRLQLEKDVLEKAAELIKKDKGVILKELTNKEKAIVIDTLRDKYPLKELLSVFNMAKSSYCYQVKALHLPDKYSSIREVIKEYFEQSGKTYGYRRIKYDLKDDNIILSEKVIRRLMKEDKLFIKKTKLGKYNSYKGEITPAVENLLKRDFHASKPNEKWLTDITEFHIPAGKVYLSPIIDCFDGLPVSWTIGIHPDAELVNTMLDNAISTLKEDEKPIVHSDRGVHYRWPDWIDKMNNAGLIRSMSKKGCSPDNSACEGFFGRIKIEMFYGKKWTGVSINQFIEILNNYLIWFCNKRRKLSLGGLSPIEYRKKMGYLAA